MAETEYFINIMRGKVSNHRLVKVYGLNSDVDTSTSPETVWNGSGIYTGFNATVPQRLSISSGSTADTANGTGARTFLIEGLDGNYDEISEVITLNGTSAVLTTKGFRRVQQAIVQTVGSGGSNAGVLTCTQQTTTANVMFAMPAGQNRTHFACFTVPRGYTGYLFNPYFTLVRESGQANYDREAVLNFYIREFGDNKPFVSQEPIGVTTGTAGKVDGEVPIPVPEKADIRMDVIRVSSDNSAIAAGFDIILVKNQP